MTPPCFVPATPALSTTFLGSSLSNATSATPAPLPRALRRPARAELDLIPGIPPGEDARENAPLRYYVPRPVETYENRGFATILPKTWEGETQTIGVVDLPALAKNDEKAAEERIVKVDAASTGAFVQFAQMMKDEREKELDMLKERNAAPTTGRATCGEEEGKAFVSNYRPVLVDGVKAVEYWGEPNGPVPRLFGGPTA